ncbi:MAG: porin family protein [Bacteroidota bacterium]
MKTILLTITAVLAATIITTAQGRRGSWDKELYVGGTAGYGHSWVDNMPNVTEKSSASIGASFITTRSRLWAWGAGLTVNSLGFNVARSESGTSTLTPVYLRIPVRGYYFFAQGPVRPMAYLGPEVGVKVAERSTGRSISGDAVGGQISRWDAGLSGGLGLNIRFIKSTWINLSADYYRGMVDAVRWTGGAFNENRNFGGSIGIFHTVK